MESQVSDVSDRKRVGLLFKFLESYAKARQAVALNVSAHEVFMSFPPPEGDNEWIAYSFQDSSAHPAPMLQVRKPDFKRCPEPDAELLEWLADGWDDYHLEVKLCCPEEAIQFYKAEDQPVPDPLTCLELYPETKELYEIWIEARGAWREEQVRAEKATDLFTTLFEIATTLRRDGETMELMAASMFFRRKGESQVDHPVFLKRAAVKFDTDEDVLSVVDTDAPPYLYEDLFTDLDGIEATALKDTMSDLQNGCWHPFDRDVMPFLARRFIRCLSSRGQYYESAHDAVGQDTEYILYQRYGLVLMKKPTGAVQAIRRSLEALEMGLEIPNHLLELVGAKRDRELPALESEMSIERRLAATDGEDPDILLAKAANREQLEIARLIEQTDAVLVQGPPGTGKTHTIANLIGHFLSQGKRVLITSSKDKALTVLKEKLPTEVSALCVAVLGDSNADLERSVDAIVDKQASTSLSALHRSIRQLQTQREAIIAELSHKRHQMFEARRDEAGALVIDGVKCSTIEVAQRVADLRAEGMDRVMPGPVSGDAPFPYSEAELADLYGANARLSTEDEEVLGGLAGEWDSWYLPEPHAFRSIALEARRLISIIEENCKAAGWDIVEIESGNAVRTPWGALCLPLQLTVDRAKDIQNEFRKLVLEQEWMVAAAADGMRGPEYIRPWNKLCEMSGEAYELAASYHEKSFGHVVSLGGRTDYAAIVSESEKQKDLLQKGKFAAFVSSLFGGGSDELLQRVTVDGEKPSTVEQLQLVEQLAELEECRAHCAAVWDQLISANGGPKFAELSIDHPERIAKKWRGDIERSVSWKENAKVFVARSLSELELPSDVLPKPDEKEDETSAIRSLSAYIAGTFDALLDVLIAMRHLDALDAERDVAAISIAGVRGVCREMEEMHDSLMTYGDEVYEASYSWLLAMKDLAGILKKRNSLLSRIEECAPAWAAAVRAKVPPHDTSIPPSCMVDAWKYGHEVAFLERVQHEDADSIQRSVIELSEQYRRTTAKLAANKAWYAMIERNQGDIRLNQALNGWKANMRKIGKGTGKYAAARMVEARRQMAECQGAVPAWIMPMSRAMSMLNPMENQFDVLIIDEASQADITALPLLTLAKKLVVVGDDEQVNPVDIGMKTEIRNALAEITIDGVIPNAGLYGPGCSLYDLMGTTLPRLMLREHFRCVPDIIGFSDSLSYDNKIKRLRDAGSSELVPALVEYHVADGHRAVNGKRNEKEAVSVVDIIEACLAQPEYKNKTFGVITMLSGEQDKLVEKKLLERFDMGTVEKHRILCGTAANFQGDERDVIILSLVDSSGREGPLTLHAEGKDNERKKRYNVAVSRAKDQLWVVHSLDPEHDLKSNDLRRRLIEYVRNPLTAEAAEKESAELADSPFEKEVAAALRLKGYRIQQQYHVGSYRIDIALIQDETRIAIECDGERWDSSDEQILGDMERQAILERMGWRFIRIRGSRYYSDKQGTLEAVFAMLEGMGIATSTIQGAATESSDLLRRVLGEIDSIQRGRSGNESSDALRGTRERRETIVTALSTEASESPHDSPAKARLGRESARVSESKRGAGAPVGISSRTPAGRAPSVPKAVPAVRKESAVAERRSAKAATSSTTENVTDAGNVIRRVAAELEADCIPVENGEFLVVCGLEGRQSIEDAASAIGYRSDYRAEGCGETRGRSCWSLFPIAGSARAFSKEVLGKVRCEVPDPIVAQLKAAGVEYYDKRGKQGLLWVVDAYGVDKVIDAINRSMGVRFGYREEGGRATRGRAAWYLNGKEKPIQLASDKLAAVQSRHVPQKSSSVQGARRGYSLAKPLRVEYERLDLQEIPLSSSASYAGESVRRSIASRMERIIECEAPIERDYLFSRVRDGFGLKRSGIDIQNVNNSVLNGVPHKETLFNGKTFLWREGDDPAEWPAFRPNGADNGGANRSIEQIAPEEIVAAARYVLQATPSGLSKDALVAMVRRQFGFQRAGRTIRETIELALGDAVASGAIDQRGSCFYLP